MSEVRLRLPDETAEAFDKLAAETGSSREALLREAADAYLAWIEQRRVGVGRGLADAEAGRVVEHEAVARWLRSWGTPDELPPPTCPG